MARLKLIKYVLAHKTAMFAIWLSYETKISLLTVVLHDLDKVVGYLLIGKSYGKIHKKLAKHHKVKFKDLDDKTFAEKYLDMASARITKKDKPEDALDYILSKHEKFYDRAIKHYKEVRFK